MASDKVNYPEAGSIAQAMKHQIRSGSFWDSRSPAEKESIDQIATAIARMVVGDGAHWDAIIGYAHAAKPGDDPLKNDRSFDYPYTVPSTAPAAEPAPSTIADIERGMRRLVRDLPRETGNG